MFSLFRVRYPLGSLSTELLTIHEGKYVVRAVVQVEGITLATGLAAAPEVELAEDKATTRALNLLGMAAETATQSAALEAPIEAPKPEPVITPERVVQPNPIGSHSETLSVNDTPEFSASQRPRAAVPSPAASLPTYDVVPFADDEFSPAQSELYEEEAFVETPEEVSGGLFGSQFNSPGTKPGYHSSNNVNSARKVEDLGAPTTADMSWGGTTPAGEEIDLRDAIGKITIKLKELRWNKDQERDYLERSFGKRDRNQLTEKEWLKFLDYLETLSQTTHEIKRLGWNKDQGRQGRDYLQRTYGRPTRAELNEEELLEFLHYLESQPTPEN